jgi:hypothetical protein
MKNIPLLVVISFFAGCSINNDYFLDSFGNGTKRDSRMIHYIHLVVGDSLGYDYPSNQTARHYTFITGTEMLRGKTYYEFQNYLLDIWGPTKRLREDSDGNIFLAGFDSSETLLYKTNVDVGTTWTSHYDGPTTCTLESRTDSITTSYATFTNCLRINLGCEFHWLAPNIGLVKRDFRRCPTLKTTSFTLADLKSLKLKSISRR